MNGTCLLEQLYNMNIAKLFNEHGIELFSVKSAYKAAIVERFNRTLKSKVLKYFTMTLKEKWTNVLQDVVSAYNNSVHRTIGYRPIDVTSANVGDVRDELYKKKSKAINETRDIKIGDVVRIFKVKSVFAKGYLPNWTEELFTVTDINTKYSPTTYKLKDYNEEVIEGSFYRHEIQKVSHTDDTFLVEKIIRTQKRGNESWCLVKWQGYPSSMNSWVRKRDVVKVMDRGNV